MFLRCHQFTISQVRFSTSSALFARRLALLFTYRSSASCHAKLSAPVSAGRRAWLRCSCFSLYWLCHLSGCGLPMMSFISLVIHKLHRQHHQKRLRPISNFRATFAPLTSLPILARKLPHFCPLSRRNIHFPQQPRRSHDSFVFPIQPRRIIGVPIIARAEFSNF